MTTLPQALSCVRNELSAGAWTLERLAPAIARLESFVFEQAQDQADLPTRLRGDVVREMQTAYGAWETLLEKQFARRVVDGAVTEQQAYPLSQRFQRLLGRELNLVPGEPPKRACFLGSGPLPISAIWLHRITGAAVDCVDHEPEAVELSRRYLASQGLEREIRVHLNEGEAVDPTGYDMILVALLAKPKHGILRQLRRAAQPNCRVVCRTSHGLRQLLYEPTDVSTAVEPWFHVISEAAVLDNAPDTISSFALRQRE